MRTAVLSLWIATGCYAQTLPGLSRDIEVYGTVGALRGGGDEGYAGAGSTYGAALTIPFADRWAFDLQALSSRPENRPDFRFSQVLISPAIQYRRGSDRARWFIAFGPGLQRESTRSEFETFESPTQSRLVSFRNTQSGLTLHWRTGAVFQPADRILVRGEFFWVNRYVLPTVGVAISLGLRLGR